MKLNWGKSIVLAMILFIGFIMFMVIQMTTKDEFDHDMVVEEYYKKELTLNDKIQQTENGKAHEALINFTARPNGLLLAFPEQLSGLKNLQLEAYRPSDKSLDFNLNLKLNQNQEVLVDRAIAKGIWKFTISYDNEQESYLISKTLNVQ